jgi:vacuolar-type H+-ATPase subunit I/STV1
MAASASRRYGALMDSELSSAPSRTRRAVLGIAIAGVVVTLAAAVCGGFFGSLARIIYSFGPHRRALSGEPGGWAGFVSGAAVGIGWSWAMTARARDLLQQDKPRHWRFVGLGVLLGLVAGCVSALCVHGTIEAIIGELSWENIAIGLVFGAVSGSIVGLLGALLILVVVFRARDHR